MIDLNVIAGNDAIAVQPPVCADDMVELGLAAARALHITQPALTARIQALEAANIPVTPVNTKEALLDDAQLHASNFWQFVDHPTEGKLRMTDAPVRFSGSQFELRQPAPTLGEHSESILIEAGYSPQEVDQLFASGVTAGPRLSHPSP